MVEVRGQQPMVGRASQKSATLDADIHPTQVNVQVYHVMIDDVFAVRVLCQQSLRTTQPDGIHLQNWLEAQILRREVESLLHK